MLLADESGYGQRSHRSKPADSPVPLREFRVIPPRPHFNTQAERRNAALARSLFAGGPASQDAVSVIFAAANSQVQALDALVALEFGLASSRCFTWTNTSGLRNASGKFPAVSSSARGRADRARRFTASQAGARACVGCGVTPGCWPRCRSICLLASANGHLAFNDPPVAIARSPCGEAGEAG